MQIYAEKKANKFSANFKWLAKLTIAYQKTQIIFEALFATSPNDTEQDFSNAVGLTPEFLVIVKRQHALLFACLFSGFYSKTQLMAFF